MMTSAISWLDGHSVAALVGALVVGLTWVFWPRKAPEFPGIKKPGDE